MKKSISRRRLLRQGLSYLSSLTLLGYPLNYSYAIPKFNNLEDSERRRNARFHMTFASPYLNEDWRSVPHVHQEFKYNVETMSKGQVYVEIADNGRLGVGPELTAAINYGLLNSALVSVSNLAPAARELDILNIPFWSADYQSYLNLVTSSIWRTNIEEKIRGQGRLDILFYYLIGARTASTTANYAKIIKKPGDMKNKLCWHTQFEGAECFL